MPPKPPMEYEKVGSGEKVVCPRPTHVPDWSDETMALMEKLTPLQQAFVAWRVAGRTSAEAYRLASGRGDEATGCSQIAYVLNRKPDIQAAIAAAIRDRNFGARMDREWILMKCMTQIEECENSSDPQRKKMIPQLLRLAAELKGEITQKHEHKVDATAQPSDVSQRMDRLLEAAERALGVRKAGDTGDGQVRVVVPAQPALGS